MKEISKAWHRSCRWGTAYFAVVFVAGFLLGVIRVLIVEPRIGTRWAELLEMPWMGAAMLITACWIVRQTQNQYSGKEYCGIGVIALALLLAAEAVLVLRMRGISLSEYVASRDPISGIVYLAMLVLFAAMPWICSRWSESRRGRNGTSRSESYE